MDEELEDIKRKKLEELKKQAALEENIEQEKEQKDEFEKQKKLILIRALTPKARERLGNIKVARPQIAEQIENQLIILVQSGRLKNKINDIQLRELLKKMIPTKRDIKIKRR